MVGKPNLPDAGEYRPDLQGAARPTPGLSALDQEREASMADEGGASGAVMERELPTELEGSPRGVGGYVTGVLVMGAAVGLAVAAVRFSRRG
jgi:hypothetical protein